MSTTTVKGNKAFGNNPDFCDEGMDTDASFNLFGTTATVDCES